jgi:hypothetical protein
MTMTGKILTANRLGDGLVVFLNAANVWTRNINTAVLAREPDAEAALANRGQEFEASNHVTGAYLVAAERTAGTIKPLHIRERIRSVGPSIHPEFSIAVYPTELSTEGAHVSV